MLSRIRRTFPCDYVVSLQIFSTLSRVRSRECVVGAGRSFSEQGGGEGKGKTVNVSVSSLRIDTVAAAGLAMSRQKIWEASLDNLLFLNGKIVKKKSESVSEGDIIEVDTVLQSGGYGASGETGDEVDGALVNRGRVEVVEIGDRTRKGGYHVTLTRYKHYHRFRITS